MKIALVGLGHLGKIHFKCLKETPFELAGIYDPKCKGEYEGVACEAALNTLLDKVDACIIAATTSEHYEIAKLALEKGLHCFVEKPLAATVEEVESLVELAGNNEHLTTQVGFVERYNPAFTFLEAAIDNPRFIEVHRLAQFNPRGTDVSVIFDLMIHDLDLLLAMKNEAIREVKATGVQVYSESLDICNARIEFEDNSVANLTASRMSMKVMRKFRIFQNQGYLSMDLHKKESQIIKLSDQEADESMKIRLADKEKHLVLKSSGILEGNAIVDEINDFYTCITAGKQSKASFRNALKTSLLAREIEAVALKSIS